MIAKEECFPRFSSSLCFVSTRWGCLNKLSASLNVLSSSVGGGSCAFYEAKSKISTLVHCLTKSKTGYFLEQY